MSLSDFTMDVVELTSHPCNFFAFAPFSILIEDPEGNMVRSVELLSFYLAYASIIERSRGRLFSRDPADARDVPAGPLVAPPRRQRKRPMRQRMRSLRSRMTSRMVRVKSD